MKETIYYHSISLTVHSLRGQGTYQTIRQRDTTAHIQ